MHIVLQKSTDVLFAGLCPYIRPFALTHIVLKIADICVAVGVCVASVTALESEKIAALVNAAVAPDHFALAVAQVSGKSALVDAAVRVGVLTLTLFDAGNEIALVNVAARKTVARDNVVIELTGVFIAVFELESTLALAVKVHHVAEVHRAVGIFYHSRFGIYACAHAV